MNMDAIALLVSDHDKVEQLFQQIEVSNPTPAKAKGLFEQIYHELSVHTVIEEQVFYPSLAKYSDFASLLKDAYKEHAEVKRMLAEIANLEPASAQWRTEVARLNKDIKHHVKDEEEKLFPKVREKFNSAALHELGTQLEQAKSSQLNGALLSQPHPLSQSQSAN